MPKTITELFDAMIEFSLNRKNKDALKVDTVKLEEKEIALETLRSHLEPEVEILFADCSDVVLKELHPERHLTLIQFSALLGDVVLSEVLFKKGADIEQRDPFNQNSIDIARRYGRPELVNFLTLLSTKTAPVEEIAKARMSALIAEAEKALLTSREVTAAIDSDIEKSKSRPRTVSATAPRAPATSHKYYRLEKNNFPEPSSSVGFGVRLPMAKATTVRAAPSSATTKLHRYPDSEEEEFLGSGSGVGIGTGAEITEGSDLGIGTGIGTGIGAGVGLPMATTTPRAAAAVPSVTAVVTATSKNGAR